MRFIALLLAALPLLASAMDAPFGFRQGMPMAEIERIGPLRKLNEHTYELRTAPRPHQDFDVYVLRVTARNGLCYVGAWTDALVDDKEGTVSRGVYKTFKAQLDRIYGPAEEIDFIEPSSPYQSPQQWLRAVEQKHRFLASYWEKAPAMKDQVRLATLEVVGLKADRSAIYLGFDFQNKLACDHEIEMQLLQGF